MRDAVRVENVVGKNAFIDQIGSATAALRTSRHADTPQMDTPHDRRRLSLADYEYADLVDDQDKVRMLIDPTSSMHALLPTASGSCKWMMSSSLLQQALQDTGETGSGSASLDATANSVGSSSSNDGLTLAKLS